MKKEKEIVKKQNRANFLYTTTTNRMRHPVSIEGNGVSSETTAFHSRRSEGQYDPQCRRSNG